MRFTAVVETAGSWSTMMVMCSDAGQALCSVAPLWEQVVCHEPSSITAACADILRPSPCRLLWLVSRHVNPFRDALPAAVPPGFTAQIVQRNSRSPSCAPAVWEQIVPKPFLISEREIHLAGTVAESRALGFGRTRSPIRAVLRAEGPRSFQVRNARFISQDLPRLPRASSFFQRPPQRAPSCGLRSCAGDSRPIAF